MIYDRLVCIFIVLHVSAYLCEAFQSCSWTKSEEDDGSVDSREDTVRLVQMNCTDGKVDWRQPRGALIMRFSAPSDADVWQLCIRPTVRHSDVFLSVLESGSVERLKRLNASVDHIMCATSVQSTLSLYIELKPATKIYRRRASFYYAVVKNSANATITSLTDQPRDVAEQCKPCTSRDLLNSFCTADLVFKGKLLSNVSGFLRFNVVEMIRKPMLHDAELLLQTVKHKLQALVQAPETCYFENRRVASLEFLIAAKMRLGRARALCVPLWSDWLNIRHELLLSPGSTPCDVT